MQNEGEKPKPIEVRSSFVGGKPGMENVDQEKINKIVLEISKNTSYYQKVIESRQNVESRIEKVKKKVDSFLKDKQLVYNTAKLIERKIESLENERNLKETWVSFDLDMFYVACEIRDNPELADKPVTVGSMTYTHTANYIARKYGIRCNMPGFIAKKLCPELVIIRGNYRKYRETADRFKEVIKKYDPTFESRGKGDEASVNFTQILLQNKIEEPEAIEKFFDSIRESINKATGITVSCGIAPNKMLAKICSDHKKPNGLFRLNGNREEILNFVAKLPIRKIPGIGVVNEQVLHNIGIMTCSDILEKAALLYAGFTEGMFEFFLRVALGLSGSFHDAPDERKSLRVGETFMVDDFTRCEHMTDVEQMKTTIKDIAESLSEDLNGYQLLTKHVMLSLKNKKFEIQSKSFNIGRYVTDAETLTTVGVKLLKEMLPVEPLRQIVLTATDLIKESKLHSGLDKYFKPKENIGVNDHFGKANEPNKAEEVNYARKQSSADAEAKARNQSSCEKNENSLTKDKFTNNDDDQSRYPGDELNSKGAFSEYNSDNLNSLEANLRFTHTTTTGKENPSDLCEKPDLNNEKSLVKKGSLEAETSNEIPKTKLIPCSEVVCPICKVKFESSINSTRINNHIDKCLLGSSEIATNSGKTLDKKASQEKSGSPGSIKPENDSSGLKRKAQNPLTNSNSTKKSKKTEPPAKNSSSDITKFFFKK